MDCQFAEFSSDEHTEFSVIELKLSTFSGAELAEFSGAELAEFSRIIKLTEFKLFEQTTRKDSILNYQKFLTKHFCSFFVSQSTHKHNILPFLIVSAHGMKITMFNQLHVMNFSLQLEASSSSLLASLFIFISH